MILGGQIKVYMASEFIVGSLDNVKSCVVSQRCSRAHPFVVIYKALPFATSFIIVLLYIISEYSVY